MDESLAQAVEDLLRDVAEQEVLTRFGKLGEGDVRQKGKNRSAEYADLVTTADLEAENRIHEGLLKLMPESTVSAKKTHLSHQKSSTVWVKANPCG